MEVLPRLLDLNTQQRLVSERCSLVEVLSNSRTDDRALRGCRCGEPENDPFLAAAHVFRSTTANPPRPSLALRLSPLLGSFHPSPAFSINPRLSFSLESVGLCEDALP